MADISFDYTPTTGAVLSPDGINQDLYQQAVGKSLFETLNGHVELSNLKSTFAVQSHLVRPGQTGFARTDGRVFSADYFSDLWAGNNADQFVPVAGACISFRVPYNVTVAVMSASVFLTQWRQFGAPVAGVFENRASAPKMFIQTFFGDNNGVVATRRELAQTVFFDPAAVYPAANVSTVEARTCHHYNLLHYKIAGKAAPNDQLVKGYATFGFALYIPQNLSGQDVTATENDMTLALNGGATTAAKRAYYSAIHRARVYVRNATVMTLL